jgi:hypothetical protein
MTRVFIGPLLVLVFVLSAGALSPRPTAKSTLRLPAIPYRYANVELPAVAAAAAQAPGPRPAVLIREIVPMPFAGPARSPAAVIERLESFDANADHRISRDELPERMQGLVARGDRNADAALDSDEIHGLLDATLGHTRVSFRPQSSEGLPGVISDLKLPPAKHARALAIVSAHRVPGNVKGPASKEFHAEMSALLDKEEYENFVAAAARLSRSPRIIFKPDIP